MANRRIGYQDGGDVMDDIGAGPPVLNPGAMTQPRQAGGGGRGLSGLISQGISNAKQECMEDAVGRGSRNASAECADAGTFARGGPVGYANGGAVDQSWDNFDWLKNFNQLPSDGTTVGGAMTTPKLPSYGGGSALPTSPAQTALQGVANSNRSAFSPMPTVGGAITSPSARPYQPSSIPTATPAPSSAPAPPTPAASTTSPGWSQLNETVTAPSNYSGGSTIGAPGRGPGGQTANGTIALAQGGPVGYANGGAIQPGADMNRRASLLAGLRKRYDAMIGMAQGALAHRDENAAVRFAQRAHDMVPDGKSLILHVQPDGNVLAIVHDPRGGEQSRHIMTPDQFHHYLIGPATSFDHVIDNGVGHNLGIATGRPTPRTPDHPADPIHKVRQVLQHTRKMFGVDKIGQAPPRVGYAAGGPVRGYYDGGDVDPGTEPLYDDTSIDPSLLAPGVKVPTEADYALSDQIRQRQAQQDAQDTPWQQLVRGYQAGEAERDASAPRISQDERDNPPPPEETPWDKFQRGYGYDASAPDPGTEPAPAELPPVDEGARTAGSIDDYMLNAQRGMASAPAQRDAPTQQESPATAGSGMGELLARAAKEKWNRNLANAPESASVPGAIAGAWGSVKQGLADYINGTNAAPPAAVEQALNDAAQRDPNGDTAKHVQDAIVNEAPAGPIPTDPTGNAPEKPPAGSGTSGIAATDPQKAADALSEPPNWMATAGYPTGAVPAATPAAPARTGYAQQTPQQRPNGALIDRNTGEVLRMTKGAGRSDPMDRLISDPADRGKPPAWGSLMSPGQRAAAGFSDVVPSDKYGRSREQQAAEGARPWTQDMARPIGSPMPRGAPPMYVTERPAPYYDQNTGQVVTPSAQVMPGSGPPTGVAPGSPQAGKPPAWQPPPNIPGAVGAAPPAGDMSPAAVAARAFPMASQTRQRVQYQGTLERQAQEDQLKRDTLTTKDTPADRMARERLKQDGYTVRNMNNNQQKQFATDTRKIISDNTLFQRAYDTLAREAGGAAAELLKDYRARIMNDPNYKGSDEELGAIKRANDIINKTQNTAPPTPQPGPAAPIQAPAPGTTPAAPQQPGAQSVLRVPQPAQNLAPAPQPRQPAPAAIQALKADPRRRTEFDNYYGPGASARYLGQ